MDIQRINPLGLQHVCHRHFYRRCLYHPTVHLSLRASDLSPLRRLPLRRQRFLPLLARRWRHPVLAPAVCKPGRGQRRQSTGEFDMRLCRWAVGVVFLWG